MTNAIQAVAVGVWRAIRWSFVDAGLGALCAALFGMIFGGFETMINGDPSRIIVTAGYFSICGAVAGAILGAFGAFLEHIDAPVPGSLVNPESCSNQANGILGNSELLDRRYVRTPTALANSLIARGCAENVVRSAAVSQTNIDRLSLNGLQSTPYSSRLAVNGSDVDHGPSIGTVRRRRPQRVRWITEDESDE